MIMHELVPSQRLVHGQCGYAAHLIETRGRAHTDPRLFGMPMVQFHVECALCGVCTPPAYEQRTAEHLWLSGEGALVPLTQLPSLRVVAERSLLAA